MLRPKGELDAASYRGVSDDLVKFAMDEPRALIVSLDRLNVPSDPLFTAFSAAWMRTNDWPSVPILLVAESIQLRERLIRAGIHRFLAVFDSVVAALAAADTPPIRRRACVALVPNATCSQRARRFVEDVCERWAMIDVRLDALLVATELVENSFLHASGFDDIVLRLELRDELLTVAVADNDPHEAILREPTLGLPRLHGLHIVARMARAWGCAPRWPTGKVVWATLPTGVRRQRG